MSGLGLVLVTGRAAPPHLATRPCPHLGYVDPVAGVPFGYQVRCHIHDSALSSGDVTGTGRASAASNTAEDLCLPYVPFSALPESPLVRARSDGLQVEANVERGVPLRGEVGMLLGQEAGTASHDHERMPRH